MWRERHKFDESTEAWIIVDTVFQVFADHCAHLFGVDLNFCGRLFWGTEQFLKCYNRLAVNELWQLQQISDEVLASLKLMRNACID